MNTKTKVILIVMLFSLIAICAGCTQKTQDDYEMKYKIVDGTAVITGYKDKVSIKELIIPDEINGYPVTEIKDFSLFNTENLETIKIGKNVSKIGAWAFTNNTSLREFVVDTENQYFCSIDGVLFSKDMKTLIYYPINHNGTDNKSAQKYVIPDGVKVIRSKAFYKCGNIQSVVLPDSIEVIEEKAFHRCTSLKNITLPKSLKIIQKDAFAFCEGLTQISVPENVVEIDEYAFYCCTNLKTLNMFCSKDKMVLGKKWYPTNNGNEISDLKIVWETDSQST